MARTVKFPQAAKMRAKRGMSPNLRDMRSVPTLDPIETRRHGSRVRIKIKAR